MHKLIVKGPINALSFGNVTLNILKALFDKEGLEVLYTPTEGNLDFSVFDTVPEGFKKQILESAQSSLLKLDKDIPALNIWHINGSHNLSSRKNFLYTFHETSVPTATEISLVNYQDKTIFSSKYSEGLFKGTCPNVASAPLGFDPTFSQIEERLMPKDVVHFGLMGKWEKRKHTEQIIKQWIKLFGDNPKMKLTCVVDNPFFKPEIMQQLKMMTLGGQRVTNVTFLPFLQNNSLVNDYMNSIDIDLSGLSGAEGWNLPSFNTTCLGKWSVVLNATAHKDWATKDNAIIVEPNGVEPCYDNAFFREGHVFNQGDIYTFSDDAFEKAINSALEKVKSSPKNEAGLRLSKSLSYDRTAEEILSHIF